MTMRAAGFAKACVLAVLLVGVAGRAGTSVSRVAQALRSFHANIQTLEGEQPSLNYLDRLVVSVVLAGPASSGN